MHILDEEFRKELVDIYTGKINGFNRPKDIFYSVLGYLNGEEFEDIDKVRKLVDELADWTNNPTESELRKILDVEEKVSGYGITLDADDAIAVVTYCIIHGIPCDFNVERKFYKVSFKDITISQRDAIIKMSDDIHFISSQLYPKENGKEN